MATDARLAVGLATHPKTKKLVRRLGGEGAWRLVCLFLWCAANRPNGNLAGLSDEDIELAVDWTGGEGELVATLCDVGFLDGDEFRRTLHDWEEHNPWVAGSEARSDKARWAALCKKHGRNEAARRMPEYAERIGVAGGKHAPECPAHTVSADPAVLESASSTPVAAPDSASSMPLAESSTAPSLSPSPSPNTKDKTTSSAGADLPARFSEFWAAWPNTDRKVAKAKCAEKWRKARLGEEADSILAHIRQEKANNRQWLDGFEPAPLTYLNQRRWGDRSLAGDSTAPGEEADAWDVLAALRSRFPGAEVKLLGDGRYRVGNRFFGPDGNPEPVL
ncbi:hypothetical protein VCS63_23480 [Achromobacter sp. D10]|uniref:hypothetical protein n=1 Tax=Achromobacter sp. D10 TaxID=3110765 RepID=UPI002B4AA25C|nr:hypothetical protein [Achromobacter sp. D10]MEB3098818.1 hypothetical protein [Achromobacter sp. D10]